MSTGQRLREVKDEIARIERFIPVMKRVLTMLRVEIRAYQDKLSELEARVAAEAERWQEAVELPVARTIEASVEVEAHTRRENLVGVDIDEVRSVTAHCQLSQVLICASSENAALADLACLRRELGETDRIERQNLARLQEAEEEFVFLINGSEQVRLPPLREELARLARELDEENGMAATIARLLREGAGGTIPGDEVEIWPPLG